MWIDKITGKTVNLKGLNSALNEDLTKLLVEDSDIVHDGGLTTGLQARTNLQERRSINGTPCTLS